MRYSNFVWLCIFLASHLAAPISAQVVLPAPDLVTDRPDQTESASVVPRGWGQIELGWTFGHDDEAGVDVETVEGPDTLLRLGVHERIELRVGWDGHVRQRVDSDGGRSTFDGLGDMSLGAKILLAEGTASRPQVALLLESTVPVGDEEVTSDSYDPSFRFNFDHDLSDRTGLGINLGAQWQETLGPSGREEAGSFLYTAALGHSLTDRWGTFVEIYGSESFSGPDLPGEISLDGGVTWLLRPYLQFDLAGGIGLSESAEDWFVGLGVSYRWPD